MRRLSRRAERPAGSNPDGELFTSQNSNRNYHEQAKMLSIAVVAATALRSAPLPVGSTSSLRNVQRVAHVVLREDAVGPPAARPAAAVPPPPTAATVAPEGGTTATSASLPPDSFLELVEHAAESTRLAISEGSRLIEVEFPPLPVSQLDEPSLRRVTH